jgi:hypothetical protein
LVKFRPWARLDAGLEVMPSPTTCTEHGDLLPLSALRPRFVVANACPVVQAK